MAVAPVQKYWETAPWEVLYELIAQLDAGEVVEGFEPDHRFLEDIRKSLFVLEFPGAGAESTENAEVHYAVYSGAPSSDGIQYRKGEWIVSHEDVEFGWLLWYNWRDVNDGESRAEHPPPSVIHPEDNVLITESGWWRLCADRNKYHQWDKNAPFMHFARSSVGSMGNANLTICFAEGDAHLWLPYQTDPKENHPLVFFKDTEKFEPQFKEKVQINRKFITQPESLGALFTSFLYGFRNLGADSVNDPYDYVRRDPWLLKPMGGVAGGQYHNAGGMDQNTPGFGVRARHLYPDRLPWTGAHYSWGLPSYNEWYFNPKANHAYQNRVELRLCAGGRLPANTTYTANWANENGVTPGKEDEDTNWVSHPTVGDECWGENESGFELYLQNRGEYDWWFNLSTRYVPQKIVKYIAYLMGRTGSGGPISAEQIGIDFDLNEFSGTFRRTYKYSMGRLSPYMRSKEMGEPEHIKDSWNPTGLAAGSEGVNFTDRWYGARTRICPAINEFDDRFIDINTLARIDPYEFTIKERRGVNYAEDLKVGWMVHFCSSENQKIYDVTGEIPNIVPWAYITKIRYEDDAWHIRTTIDSTSFSLMGWNKEVSQRHDAIQVTEHERSEARGGGMERLGEFTQLAHILQEMRDLLRLFKYKDLSLSYAKAMINIGGDADSPPYDSAGAVFRAGNADMWPDYESDPDDWVGSWGGHLVSYNGASYIPGSGGWFDGVSAIGASNASGWREEALSISGDDEAIAFLHGRILVRIKYMNMATPKTTAYHFPCIMGVGSDAVVQGLEAFPLDWHYRDVSFPVGRIGEKTWVRFRILNGLPGALYSYANPSTGAMSSGGMYEIFYGYNSSFAAVILDMEKIPASVFERCHIGHVDAPTAPHEDTEAPRPNPPVHHKIPHAYFKYVAEFGSPGDPDYAQEHFELRITGDSVLCEDIEGSGPVKYRAVETDDNAISPWSIDRAYDILVRNLTISEAIADTWYVLDTAATTNPSGTITRISYVKSKALNVGDEIAIRDSTFNDGPWPVVGVDAGGTWFEIDKGWYNVENINGADIKYWREGYDELSWAYELCRNWQLAIQTKDSNVPQPNVSELSRLKSVVIPDEWPKEIWDELNNASFEPPV